MSQTFESSNPCDDSTISIFGIPMEVSMLEEIADWERNRAAITPSEMLELEHLAACELLASKLPDYADFSVYSVSRRERVGGSMRSSLVWMALSGELSELAKSPLAAAERLVEAFALKQAA